MAILRCGFDEDGKLFKAFQAIILEISGKFSMLKINSISIL